MRIGLFHFLTMKTKGLKQMNMFELVCWFAVLLFRGGGVHPNPGPDSSFGISSSSFGTSFSSPISDAFTNNLKIVHYNVQSFITKKDILFAYLNGFDILAFTETWLSPTVDTADLLFPSYHTPFRRDRPRILLYVKSDLFATERPDLHIDDIECFWVELRIKGRRLLFGCFYRPPNSRPYLLECIHNSISLAVDTGKHYNYR